MGIGRILIPPAIRGALDIAEGVRHPLPALEMPAVPVSVERDTNGRGVNNKTANVGHARTWEAVSCKIVSPNAVTNGNFSDAVYTCDLSRIADTFMFNPPPDGRTYCISFQSAITYKEDTTLGMWIPQAEFFFCNVANLPYAPCVPLPLQRSTHRFQISIWTPNAIAAAFSVTVFPVFANLGDGR